MKKSPPANGHYQFNRVTFGHNMLNISDTLHLIKPAPKKSVALAVLGGFLVLGLLCSGAVSANGVTNLLGSTSVACDDNQLHPQAPNTPLNVTPITGHPGDTYEVIITGYDFCTISLANGSDIATHLNDLNNSDPTIAPLNSKLTFTLATVGGASTYLVGGLNNTLALAFTVLDNPPMITSITPALGGGSGGTAITILGSDFVTGATAMLGGVDCTSPTVLSATSLTCTTGAHAAGNADVLVTNPDKQTGTLVAAFAYEVALTYAAEANGTLIGTTEQLIIPGGDGSVITAVANTGYHFTNWSDGLLTAARTDTNVTADATLTASFAIDTHILIYTAGANGSLTGASPQTIDYGSNGASVTAVANTGYHFVSWSDGLLSDTRTDSNITADASVSASFALNIIPVTVTANTVSFNFGTLASVSYTANGFISPATFILKPVCGAYKTSDTTFAKALVLSKTSAVGTYVTHCKSATVNAGSYSLAYADGLLTIVAVVPDAPKEVKATAGNTSASVSFKVPASNGGTPITRYTVVSNTGIITTGTKSPICVTGLKNGSSYTFKVMATNSQGNSSYSAFSTAIKPAAPKKKD
jgi:hypothetical protein